MKELQRLRKGNILPVKDSDRGDLLKGLVETMEYDDVSCGEINEWIAVLS